MYHPCLSFVREEAAASAGATLGPPAAQRDAGSDKTGFCALHAGRDTFTACANSRSLRLLALSRTLEQKGSRDHPTNWLAQTHKDMLI